MLIQSCSLCAGLPAVLHLHLHSHSHSWLARLGMTWPLTDIRTYLSFLSFPSSLFLSYLSFSFLSFPLSSYALSTEQQARTSPVTQGLRSQAAAYQTAFPSRVSLCLTSTSTATPTAPDYSLPYASVRLRTGYWLAKTPHPRTGGCAASQRLLVCNNLRLVDGVGVEPRVVPR